MKLIRSWSNLAAALLIMAVVSLAASLALTSPSRATPSPSSPGAPSAFPSPSGEASPSATSSPISRKLKGRFTIHRVAIGMSREEVQSVLGEGRAGPYGATVYPSGFVQYDPSGKVMKITGESVEYNGRVVLTSDMTRSQCEAFLGPPDREGPDYWNADLHSLRYEALQLNVYCFKMPGPGRTSFALGFDNVAPGHGTSKP